MNPGLRRLRAVRPVFWLLVFWPILIGVALRGGIWLAEVALNLSGTVATDTRVFTELHPWLTMPWLAGMYAYWLAALITLYLLATGFTSVLKIFLPLSDARLRQEKHDANCERNGQ
ncbi:hypothetical protein [Phytobacter diazotrophicus]|uniref:hypothetical protein n=1 Tax=Phytobacter diazotrophicus TaxID=395631 RepID=UPI002FF86374